MDDPHGGNPGTNLTELWGRLEAQQACIEAQAHELAALRALVQGRAASAEPPPVAPPGARELQPSARPRLPRRGILAGVATLLAGALSTASAKVARAADGQAVILGATNQSSGPTQINRSG